MPERFTSHRFLSVQKLAVDTVRLLDSYTVIMLSLISQRFRKYKPFLSATLKRHEVSDASKQEIDRIHAKLKKKIVTIDGKDRK